MVVVMYLIFIVSALCHFNCLVAFIKSYLYLILNVVLSIHFHEKTPKI